MVIFEFGSRKGNVFNMRFNRYKCKLLFFVNFIVILYINVSEFVNFI